MNAWRACSAYSYALHSPTCYVSELQFGGCNTNSKSLHYNLGIYQYPFTAGGCPSCPSCYSYGCGSASCGCTQTTPPTANCIPITNTCCQDCSGYLSTYNAQKWWYPAGPTCADWEFRTQVYNAQVGPSALYDPFIFCTTVAATCAGLNSVNYIED